MVDDHTHDDGTRHVILDVKQPSLMSCLLGRGARRYYRAELIFLSVMLVIMVTVAVFTYRHPLQLLTTSITYFALFFLYMSVVIRTRRAHYNGFTKGFESFPLLVMTANPELVESVLNGGVMEPWGKPTMELVNDFYIGQAVDAAEKHANGENNA